MRYEDKFLVPLSLLSEVENVFDSDFCSFKEAYPSRFVNSIYYDTDDLFYARQNSEGNGVRQKVRIRFYDNDFTALNLEVKFKYNSVGKKLVIPIPFSSELPTMPFLAQMLHGYFELDFDPILVSHPILFIRYTRKYWVSRLLGGVRITLDSCISAKEISAFCPLDSLFDYHNYFQDFGVLEIKYGAGADISLLSQYFQEHLSLRRSRFSKYVLGLIFTSQIKLD